MGGQDEMKLIKNMPDGLRRDIKRYLCLDLVRKVRPGLQAILAFILFSDKLNTFPESILGALINITIAIFLF